MKSKRSKDQIIQAALSLFSNKGYKETTMADLVTVTGLSKGAVYHHFKSKEEILQLLMEKETNSLSTFLEELSKNEGVSSTISGEEMISFSQKLDYIAFYLNSSGVPVLTENKCQEINQFFLKGGRR